MSLASKLTKNCRGIIISEALKCKQNPFMQKKGIYMIPYRIFTHVDGGSCTFLYTLLVDFHWVL